MALGLGLLRRDEIKEAKGAKVATPNMMTTLASLTLRQMSSKKISPRQKIFARNLASGMSQTEAAVEAGYSVTRARVTGCDLVQKPGVQAELQRTRDEIEEALGISPQWCAERYMVLADKAEKNGEIQNARGCLDSLSKLMGWEKNKKNDYHSKFSVESLIEKIKI